MSEECFKESFNLLCGNMIGEGTHRQVYECKIRPDLVVKVERAEYRYFANVFEQYFWDDNKDDENIAKWLAPCEYMSPEGRILLQKKCLSLPHGYKLPSKIPQFMNDVKRSNFGLIDGRLVCFDYAITYSVPNHRLTKAKWAYE